MLRRSGILRGVTCVVALAMLFCVGACTPSTAWVREEVHVTGPFDTLSTAILIGTQAAVRDARTFLEDELWRYHRLFDIYHDAPEGTNLKTVNDRAGSAVRCPAELIDLLMFGRTIHRATDGNVNIAMGRVLALWHDARMHAEAHPDDAYLPSNDDLARAAEHIDIEDVEIDGETGTVRLADPDMRLDVGAIAKGYAVERIARALEARGLTSGVLDIGGNVRTLGRNAIDDRAWRIGIRHPDPNEDALLDAVSVEHMSVVTSGIYERAFEYRGTTYAHIIDPATLFPAKYHEAVTVIGPDSGVADALSTALMTMSLDDGARLMRDHPDYEAIWATGGGTYETSGYASYRCTDATP